MFVIDGEGLCTRSPRKERKKISDTNSREKALRQKIKVNIKVKNARNSSLPIFSKFFSPLNISNSRKSEKVCKVLRRRFCQKLLQIF